MKNILIVAIAVIFTGCESAQMKQDPRKLEDHCQLEEYKDAPICKYLSAKDQEVTNAIAAMSAPRMAFDCGDCPNE